MEQRTIQQIWFLILLAAVSVAFLWLTLDFVQPVFWAAVFAVIFEPAQRRGEQLVGPRPTSAALITTIGVALLVFVPMTLVGVAVSSEALSLYTRIKDGSSDVFAFFRRVDPLARDLALRLGLTPDAIEQRVTEAASVAAQFMASRAVGVGQNLLSLVGKTGLMLYLLFFFLRDRRTLLSALKHAIPMGKGQQDALFERFAAVTRATLKGTLLVGAVQGTLGGLIFWGVGITGAVFWGVIMTLLSLVPMVGSALIWAPAGIMLLVTGKVTSGIVVLAGGALIIGSVDNVLRPILVGRETRMPDYMVLLATLGGLSAFGLAGFVAGPVLAALFLSVWGMFAQAFRPEIDAAE